MSTDIKRQATVIKSSNGVIFEVAAISVPGKNKVTVTLKAQWIERHKPEVFSSISSSKTCQELLREIINSQGVIAREGFWVFLSKNSKSAYDNQWKSDGKLGFHNGSTCSTDAQSTYSRQDVRYKGVGQRAAQRRNEHELFRNTEDKD